MSARFTSASRPSAMWSCGPLNGTGRGEDQPLCQHSQLVLSAFSLLYLEPTASGWALWGFSSEAHVTLLVLFNVCSLVTMYSTALLSLDYYIERALPRTYMSSVYNSRHVCGFVWGGALLTSFSSLLFYICSHVAARIVECAKMQHPEAADAIMVFIGYLVPGLAVLYALVLISRIRKEDTPLDQDSGRLDPSVHRLLVATVCTQFGLWTPHYLTLLELCRCPRGKRQGKNTQQHRPVLWTRRLCEGELRSARLLEEKPPPSPPPPHACAHPTPHTWMTRRLTLPFFLECLTRRFRHIAKKWEEFALRRERGAIGSWGPGHVPRGPHGHQRAGTPLAHRRHLADYLATTHLGCAALSFLSNTCYFNAQYVQLAMLFVFLLQGAPSCLYPATQATPRRVGGLAALGGCALCSSLADSLAVVALLGMPGSCTGPSCASWTC
ncbi:PREDICTED: probable G-protein coupled receptor 146 [Myotis brandtii]|uniref:probable G-protein coupled receptor 146 n=1 Tax=Myotis brandtii TaxID=109478 RepID=UPI0007041E86|nr:PREDICTED: probable G-protein coupled receptor 146 [Myotis brandtii]